MVPESVVLIIDTTGYAGRRINMLATACYVSAGRLVTRHLGGAGPIGPAAYRLLDMDFREFTF